ncbi:MAG: HlyD family secretion protein [Candidatus Symbiothrix sp.]|nr:HlyD family secretion protein [Candidatus Symbiothrix sp.]
MDKIELRSEEMQDILSRPPHILIRSGISVICSVVLLLIAGSFFFKYPDVVSGEALITTENPPVRLVARSSGKIREWNCTDKSPVSQGQVLCVIENPARTEDVKQIREILSRCLISDSTAGFPPGFNCPDYELGTIQNAWSSFLRAATEYENFLSFNAIQKEREALFLQISGHKRYSASLQKQMELKEEELKIAQTAYDREKRLYEKGVNAQAEMEVAENAYLNIRQSLQQMQTAVASDEIEAAQLIESLSKLDTQYRREKNSLLSGLKTAYSELLSAIENWEEAYLLVSPITGVVTFNTFWTNHQFVNTGDNVLAIVPHNPGEIIGRIQSPASGSGKIRPGQRVNIKVQGYPYMEYGTLQGRVKTISLISSEALYSIEAELPQGLKTGTGKILDFSGELTGLSEIVTDDRSLFSRIFSPLQYLIGNYSE